MKRQRSSRHFRCWCFAPTWPRTTAAATILACMLAGSSTGRATDTASEALARCHDASVVDEKLALALLSEGVDLAEAAAAGDPNNPVGHFAVFCNRARRLHIRGIGLGTIGDLIRARRALERSLELDPEYADALAAKGALLYYLPRFAGGDAIAGEQLMRTALVLDPRNPVRLVLVELLAQRQAITEARHQAARSVDDLHVTDDPHARAGAQALLRHLCARELPREIALVLRDEC